MLDTACGLLTDPAAGRIGAGETDLAHLRMIDQRSADLGTESGDHVDHSGRESGILQQRNEFQSRCKPMAETLRSNLLCSY